MIFEKGREPVFTQQEVTEMQKSYLNALKRITEMTKEIRIRYANKIDIKMLLKRLVDIEYEEIEIIEKDIKIETNSDQAT